MGLFDGLFDAVDVAQVTKSDWRPAPPPSLDGITDIELDVETNGLDWWNHARPGGLSVCLPDGRTQYLPWAHREGPNLDEAVVKRWAQTELKHKHITNIFTKFDVHMLREWGVDLEAQGCTVADVSHDAGLLDDHRYPNQMSLEALCKDFLPESERKVLAIGGVPLHADHMMEYPSDMVAVRAEADVRQVHALKKIFQPQIGAQNLRRVQQLEQQVIYPVCEMEKNGVHLDVELLQMWTREVDNRINRLLMQATDALGFAANPDSSGDWIRVFEKCGVPLTLSKKDKPTFTDDVLQRIEHPTIQMLRKAGKLISLKAKYLTPYREQIGGGTLLRYHLHQMMTEEGGTITGRFSASDVNIQQVMKTKKQIASFESDEFLIRQLFVPGSGQFLSADGRQIEYRIFAHYANSPRINKAFADDPLTNFHQLIYGLLKPHSAKLTYEHTKNINFMRIYGGGIVKLALMMGFITKQEAEELQEERETWRRERKPGMPRQPKLDPVMEIDAIYNRELPEVKPLLEKTKKLAEERGYVRTMIGRRGRFRAQDKRFSYKAFNIVGQGGGADYMKVKITELHQCRKVTGFKMRATVHDQVIGDCPDAESARLVGKVLDHQSFDLRIPILWEVKTGKTWAGCD